MTRLATWSAPIAAIVALGAVERIIDTADLWLGFTLVSLAILILILPARHPAAPADDASTAAAPSGGSQPTAGAIEAAPAATAER